MGWNDPTGRIHAWAGVCVACDQTFGIESANGQLVKVEAVLFDE